MPEPSTSAGIEDLREKREEVQKQIRDEETEKAKLQQDLQTLTKRLAHINDGLARKVHLLFFVFTCLHLVLSISVERNVHLVQVLKCVTSASVYVDSYEDRV